MNECNNMTLDAFDQLESRTKEFVFLDWNPSGEFWYYTDLKGVRTDIEELTVTYKDNEALDPQIIASIEQRKGNLAWWTVYGLGQLGVIESRIFRDWKIIDEIPHEAKLIRTGGDYGYSNDPTAIVDVYEYNGGYILDEVIYQKGLLNSQIADILKNKEPKALNVFDSAEPKSNAELALYGITILPANKGKGSVLQGIQKIQSARISVTSRSTNLLKEYRNYVWITDKNGKIINEPIDLWNHCMDAIRYAFETINVNILPKSWHGYNKDKNKKINPAR